MRVRPYYVIPSTNGITAVRLNDLRFIDEPVFQRALADKINSSKLVEVDCGRLNPNSIKVVKQMASEEFQRTLIMKNCVEFLTSRPKIRFILDGFLSLFTFGAPHVFIAFRKENPLLFGNTYDGSRIIPTDDPNNLALLEYGPDTEHYPDSPYDKYRVENNIEKRYPREEKPDGDELSEAYSFLVRNPKKRIELIPKDFFGVYDDSRLGILLSVPESFHVIVDLSEMERIDDEIVNAVVSFYLVDKQCSVTVNWGEKSEEERADIYSKLSFDETYEDVRQDRSKIRTGNQQADGIHQYLTTFIR